MSLTSAFPHAYPFRFVDAVLEERNADFSRGSVSLGVTCGAWAARRGEWGSTGLLAEAIAQAALLLEAGDPETGRRGFLAGLEGFQAERPPRAGERLRVDVRLLARFGPVVKFEGEVCSGGETIARGRVLVRQGDAAPATSG